jgi:microsomal dipeptidase-like Zn-dependent dipeptidase
MMLIRSVNDLVHFLTLRSTRPRRVGCLLALEGVHALNGELSNLQRLYEASFRIIGISHFFDNEAGGSMHSRSNKGLTTFGRELVHNAQKLHMLIDLAHASRRVFDEVIDLTSDPVIVSHTGARGTCDNPRNLSDDQIIKIARTGGMIGIAVFRRVVCGDQIKDVALSMRYVSDLVGVDHVGLGSDFDGAITAFVDASGLPLLTEALLAQRFDEVQIAKIMGGNALRVLQAVLPRK